MAGTIVVPFTIVSKGLVSVLSAGGTGDKMLLETGTDFLLLESGDILLLE